MADVIDKKAPMASAPMRYAEDGSVDWGNMWDSFCALALEGGPPHRATRLEAPADPDPAAPGYQAAQAEIIRGIRAVSELEAAPAEPGWIAFGCHSPSMAQWVADAMLEENVAARAAGSSVLVPVGEHFAVKGEIKNVITAVAKTTHYWRDHLAPEVKQALVMQERLSAVGKRIKGWFRRGN